MASPVVESGPEIVLILPSETESVPLRSALGQTQSNITWFPTCQAAFEFLRDHSVSVVISNAELPDGGWKDVLDALSGFAPRPNLIVSSHLADERFWAEVLNLGGYDVLLSPFEPAEVLRVCTGAWLTWKRELTEPSVPPRTATSATGAGPDLEET